MGKQKIESYDDFRRYTVEKLGLSRLSESAESVVRQAYSGVFKKDPRQLDQTISYIEASLKTLNGKVDL